MKNVKYLGFIGLGCAALLLTGCGGESSNNNTDNGSNSGNGNGNEKENVKVPARHLLTCSMSEDTEKMEVEIEFNDAEDEVKSAKISFSTEIPEGVSDDEVDTAKEYLKESICDNDSYENCKVSTKGNKVIVEADVSSSSLEEEDMAGTKDEVAEAFETQGFTCK